MVVVSKKPPALLITKDTNLGVVPGVEITGSAKQGIQQWRLKRHPIVMMDHDGVGDGVGCDKLFSMLARESRELNIYLLVSEENARLDALARTWGGKGCVRRDPQALMRLLASGATVEPTAAVPSEIPASIRSTKESLSQQVIFTMVCDVLRQHTSMGPARSVVVQEAIEAVADAQGGAVTLSEVVKEVSAEISDPAARFNFLSHFTRSKK